MRIVMLSCNTGEGHNSTARAIQEVLSARGVECDLIDVLACLSPKISRFICNWHVRLYKYAPKLWDASYRAFENMEPGMDDGAMLSELLSFGAPNLKEKLVQGHYDAAVCVHVFSGMMMTRIREQLGFSIPCYFVATDYTCSPYVDQCRMDGYFIPSPALTGEFSAVGISKEKLIPSGIPVRQSFYHSGDKKQARREMKLPEEGIMVLLICGSMGCGPMRKIAKELTEQLPANGYVVAVCGRNEKLHEALSSVESPRIHVLGYCSHMQSLMDAADLIVTKPGGLSSTEAGNKHLPMVFINAVGGCESRNFDFFLNRGYAVGSSDPEKVVAMAAELTENSYRREKMREALESGFTRNSAQIIADRIMAGTDAEENVQKGINTSLNDHPLTSEGGCEMEHLKTETLENLARSFAGESQARTRYDIYAAVARQEKQEWIARIFEETAKNELVHAQQFLEMLKQLGGCSNDISLEAGYPYLLGDTSQNLQYAMEGEEQEYSRVYPAFAETARQENCAQAAQLWENIARIESNHFAVFREMKNQLDSGSLTKKEKPIVWKCLNCGYIYESTDACPVCPVCKKDASWQEGSLNQKEIPRK